MNARNVKITVHRMTPVELPPTYIGECCREWELAPGHRGRCGLCGEVPTYVRPAP